MHRSKKIFTLIVCVIYIFSYIIHNFIIGIRAEATVDHTNIIAVFVDKDIYDDINTDIQRYATNYIQQRVSNSKATVFPINTETFHARDIVRILENLYFDGIRDQTSKLIGTILIGDIPLPVVNHDNFIFPSIYPYVDFEDQQYIYDGQTEFFVYNDNPNGQANIWHGLINFHGDTTAYTNYFNKLREYANNPGTFVDPKIRYDDFTALRRYFVPDNLQYYVNKHIFAEDAAYRRFSTLFLNILQDDHNQNIANLGSALHTNINETLNLPAEYSDDNVLAYNQALIEYSQTMQDIFDDPNNAAIFDQSDDIPTFTMFLDSIIPEFLRGYDTLFGDVYSETMRDNILAGGRRNSPNQIHSHITKVLTKDDVMFRDISDGIMPTLMDFNTVLENRLDDLIAQEQYALRIPIPLNYQWKRTTCGLVQCGDEIENYEFFFFGEKAINISSINQTHIYRGTYQNLNTIPTGSITTDITQSIGGTYNIFSQQIEANRGYNFSNAAIEIDDREENKIQGRRRSTCTDSILLGLICVARSETPYTNNNRCVSNGQTIYQGDQMETPLDFAVRRRGGASPINLIENPQNSFDHILNIPDNVLYYKHAVEPIFDMAGSKAVPDAIMNINTIDSIGNFGSMIQTSDQIGPLEFPRCINDVDMATSNGFRPKPTLPDNMTNFFSAFTMTAGHIQQALTGVIVLDRPQTPSGVGNAVSRRRMFRTIDTIYHHTAPTPDQINAMNTTTRDRPIDNIRKISFVGLGGETIALEYPNLYTIPVYRQNGAQLQLMDVDDIVTSIHDHLRQYVQEYNVLLQEQLDTSVDYYNTNPNAFNLLAQHNRQATPNRSYNLLDEDIFIDALGEDTIIQIAQLLHYHNLPRQERRVAETIEDDIEQIKNDIDINQKIAHVMQEYLVADNDQGPLQNPGYVGNGYEVAYINSDGIHTIDQGSVPAFIRNIQQAQNHHNSQTRPQPSREFDRNTRDEEREQEACNYDPLSPVPLVQWPGAVACWARQLLQKPLNIGIRTPDYQNFGNELAQQFQQQGSAMRDYGSQWSSAVQLEQQNQQTINSLPVAQQQNLQDIMQYTIADSNVSAWYVDPDQEQEKYLRLLSTRNVGNTFIRISATGDNCLITSGTATASTNLCTNPISITRNLFENEIKIPVILGNTNHSHSTKAGLTTVVFEICAAQNTQACIYKTQQINILPGDATSLTIDAPNSVIRGDRVPVIVFARDRFNNDLGLGLDSYTLHSSTGSLFDGNTSADTIDFTDFRRAQFAYDAPSDITHNSVATLVVSPTDGEQPFAGKDIIIKEPTATITTTNNTPLETIDYTLPNTLDAVKGIDVAGIEQVSIDAIPSFTVSLQDLDGVDLNTYIRIHTNNRLVQPSIIQTRTLSVDNTQVEQTTLIPQTSFFVRSGTLTVYLEPTYTAGEDILSIDIPGLDTIHIPITINPGAARRVVLDDIAEFGSPGSTFNSRVSVFDIRGNVVLDPTTITIGGIGSVTINGQQSDTIDVVGGTQNITIETTEPGSISYVYGLVSGVPLGQQIPGYTRLAVQHDLIPLTGLNVMYLNLFGNDRGNQRGYFSDIDASFINDRILNSPKLLTTTTQLINPDKLKEIGFIVSPSLRIRNLGNYNVSLLSEANVGWQLAIGNDARIRIGEADTFTLQEADSIGDISLSRLTNNTIRYIPQTTDSIITGNTVQGSRIQINGDTVFDTTTLANNLSITLSTQQHQGYPIWNVSYNNRTVGQMIIVRSDQILLTQAGSRTTIHNPDAMGMHIVFAQGSTNGEQGIGLTQERSIFNPNNAYTSIENSNDEKLTLGFRAPFHNITQFAAGQSVGEASKGFGSAFLINIGDPLVSKIDLNKRAADTALDTGIGQRIYSDPGKTILKVLPFDFNNNGQEDILIAHTDGSIKLLKNYGGTDPYTDLGDLILVADTIKDIFVGDVDANGYPDIIVRTNNNQLRVYHNNQGIFDVDGNMICLDVAGGPDSLDGVTQLFIEDMDQDGVVDIVTNDRDGSIKIFYGGSTGAGGNYVSTLAYGCDDEWEQRQEGNSVLVKQYGVELDPSIRILDDSLVRRDGLAMPPEDDGDNPLGATLPDIGGSGMDEALQNLGDMYSDGLIDTQTFQTNMAALMQSQGPLGAINDLDIDSLIQAGGEQLLRHTRNPFSTVPSYESLDSEDIAYITLPYIGHEDPIRVYKSYTDINGGILLEGDEVLVTVHIQGLQDTTITFADQLRGPRIVPRHEDGSLGDFNPGTLPDSAEIIWNQDDSAFVYMIDNISVGSGDMISFSYRVRYAGGTPMLIDVKNKYNPNTNTNDIYPDIIVTPADSCAKFAWTFYNNARAGDGYRSYTEEFEDLWENIGEYYDELTDNLGENMEEVLDAAGDVGGGLGNDIVDSFINQGRTPQSILQNISSGNPINLNAQLNMTVVDGALSDVSDHIDNALQGLCQGFTLGGDNGCIQPPVPFNMAFLSPGTFNVFGCTLFEDRGLPVFFFPGTAYILGAPVPIPYGLKQSPTDSFYWAPGGAMPSMIRMYVSPTLTAQVGFAICLGPQATANNIPQPVRDLGGNCIVMSMAIPCNQPSPEVADDEVYTQQLDPRWIDASEAGTCTQPTIAYTESITTDGVTADVDHASSPFRLVAQDPFVRAPTPIIPQNVYGFGLIDFRADPVFVDADMPSFDDFVENITLRAGDRINLNILGGMAMGLVECLVQDWMDRQIKYIINNMSQMTVGIYFPEIGDIFEGFSHLNADRLHAIFSQEASVENINTAAGEGLDLRGLDQLSARAQNNLLQQGELANLSAEISNPFELVGQMFDQINLVHIAQRDVVVPIPFIYSEDVIRYSSYLETWIQANGRIFEEWENIVRSGLGICSNRVITDDDRDENVQTARQFVAQRRQELTTQINQARTAGDNARIQELRQALEQIEQCDTFTQNARFQQFLSIQRNYELLIRDIRQNLKVLEQYQQFPLQLYEWMHVTDRYLTELSGFVGNFFGEIAYWLGTNAKRFSQYVDAIITMIGVIQTRQALINVSVNRAESCATCSNDIYDYYSCSLAFLCPQLPILPIPPFKLPNIYLDMSRINLGMQILLPNFKFVPTAIALPRIPDLPRPPRISLDIDFSPFSIPDLPLLPMPPQLPTLPPLVPQVELDLPVLPPAPMIPAISPSIQGTINAAEFIGEVMCIIKGKGVGLVSEGGVKSKIEQMTQRSWNVPFFDYINLTTLLRDAPLQGFDYQIDTFVNIQFNFNGVYDVINYMVDDISRNVTTPFTQMVNTAIEDGSQIINNNVVTDFMQDNIQGNINIDVNVNNQDLLNRQDIDIPLVDYQIVQNNLLDDLRLLEDYSISHTDRHSINQIISTLSRDNTVIAHIDALMEIHDEVQATISAKSQEVRDIQEQILDDYDVFLDSIGPDSIALTTDTADDMTWSLALFDANSQTKQLLANTPHPALSYLDTQEEIARGYQQALLANDPVSLGLDNAQHRQQQRYFDHVLDTIHHGKQILAANPSSSNTPNTINSVSHTQRPLVTQHSDATNTPASSSLPLIAQNPTNNNNPSCTSCDIANTASADLTQYVQGIWAPGTNDTMVNVVTSQDFIQNIGGNYIIYDINDDGSDDVLLRDAQSIYIKYANENDITSSDRTTYYSRYYVSPVLDDPMQLDSMTDNQGYLRIVSQGGLLSFTDTLRVKIYDTDWEVKNFTMVGQGFDDISLAWTNSTFAGDNPDGYLIQLNHRIDTHHDKYHPLSFMSNALIDRSYVLILPHDTELGNNDRLRMPYNNNPTLIRNILDTEIVDILYYDPDDSQISITLVDLSRHWKYAQISTISNIGSQTTAVYERSSPWSNQVVAGPQVLADTVGPEPTINFVRNATDEIISEGTDHQGYVSTDYRLDITWIDNVAVAYNWIEDAQGNIVSVFSGGETVIEDLFFTGMATEVYTIGAMDYNQNFTRTTITLSIDIPTIAIDEVYRDGEYAGSIVASINQDMDEGFVSFERMRTSIRESLSATDTDNNLIEQFPLTVGQTTVTGATFLLSDDIGLYNLAGDMIAILNPIDGTIQVGSDYIDQYDILVDFVSHVPMIRVLDRQAGQHIFQIYYAPASLQGEDTVTLLNPELSLEQLGQGFDAFSEGWCVKQDMSCISYISPDGHIYVPTPYHVGLRADILFTDGYITYIVKDRQNTTLYSINFVMQPLVQ